MIQYFPSKDHLKIELYSRSRYQSDDNIFSILVGKNGTGKSTLLGDIISSFISNKNFSSSSYSYPSRIIAVSTSPFDKFPFERASDRRNLYSYLGLRDLRASNFSIAHLSKIISCLIDSVYNDHKKADEIFRVLGYLGYENEVRIELRFPMEGGPLRELYETKFEEYLHKRAIFGIKRLNVDFFYNQDGSISKRKEQTFKKILQTYFNDLEYNKYRNNVRTGRGDVFVNITSQGVRIENVDSDPDDLLFLIMSGFLRLSEVILRSSKDQSAFPIKKASSGEQSIIMSLLGIASKIRDYSLVCIDEPEISLHPLWQERYIELLNTTFSFYRGCQFIIATHSPQIISRLPEKNSYIVDMESGITRSADEFINHSADFQLVNVFEYPGYKNEYLARLAINVFAKVSDNKTFDEADRYTFGILSKYQNSLNHTDPVRDLISTISKLFELYG